MAHCVDFYKKWKREPNFCGIGNIGVNQISKYLEIVDELVNTGLDDEECFKYLSSSSVNYIWFLKLKKGSPIRNEVFNKIISAITNKKAIRKKDIRSWVNFKSWSEDIAEKNLAPKEFNEFHIAITYGKKLLTAGKLEKYCENKFACKPDGTQVLVSTLSNKMRYLDLVLTLGQRNILTEMVNRNYGDNEYAALCIVFKWAADRLLSEGRV